MPLPLMFAFDGCLRCCADTAAAFADADAAARSASAIFAPRCYARSALSAVVRFIFA